MPIYFTECANEFVRVNFDATTFVFSCTFLNNSDDSQKSCSISYGVCGQETTETVQGQFTTDGSNTVSLDLMGLKDGIYCYNVTATNGATIQNIQGTINRKLNTCMTHAKEIHFIKQLKSTKLSLFYFYFPVIGATERDNTVAIALGVAMPILFLVVLVIFVGSLICCLKRRRYVIREVKTSTGN